MTDYEAAIQAEASASKELRLAARQFAKRVKSGAMLVANWGDGQGSNAIDAVRDALIEAGVFKPTELGGGDSRRKLSHAKRKAVFERDMYRCVTCGTHLDLTIDHKRPVSLGGGDELSNLQTMCMPCNAKKGAKVPA